MKKLLLGIPVLLVLCNCSPEEVSFNAQIRPILNENCAACHGGVKQSGGFGVVFREDASGETESGRIGIVPGHPQKSELYRRIVHGDPEHRMPFEKEPLKEEEIKLIRKWIAQGAPWETHWAYIPPVAADPPELRSEWRRNDIDRFILDKMQQNGLRPAPAAGREALARRLFLDLIGLPPSPEEVQAFLQDTSDDAYEKLVDSLLAAPQYGEHWASMWLDLARYADSFGYSSDVARTIWKYRDWVIDALNADKAFDQFTIEQLAGDLLPNPSVDQLIATAFHRNSMTNGEGGADHEEFRNAAVIDRINTTWETWQATTLACAQCHDHPYDPIKQTDFYSAFAFFNNTNDRNLISEFPVLKSLHEEDQTRLEEIKNWIRTYGSTEQANQMERLVLAHEPRIVPADFDGSVNTAFLNRVPDDYMTVSDSSYIKIRPADLSGIDKLYLHYRQFAGAEGRVMIRSQSPDGPVIGRAAMTKSRKLRILPIPLEPLGAPESLFLTFSSESPDFACWIDGVLFGPKLPGGAEEGYQHIRIGLDSLMNAEAKLSTPIMVEKEAAYQRTTRIFERGNWMRPGEEVSAAIPVVLNEKDQQFRNRLELAQWLVSPENPLTARVTVNRIWARLFGMGIVPTLEDFGTVGDAPTHPELLDWLAIQFRERHNWHFKDLLRQIVLSATYRQSAYTDPATLEKDPDNVWLARSPRVRLSAEQVRDQALLVSGLLSLKMYGPGVMPVQPEGIWKVSFSNARWHTSQGEDRYRRAIYTYIKRSAPYPSFLTFDASGREVCLSRRITTNTPLQALVTLNDPVYFEAARALATRMLAVEGDEQTRLRKGYHWTMGKKPGPEKLDVLRKLFSEMSAYYAKHGEEAKTLVGSADAQLAAYTIVANTLMNMDEFIVKS